MTDNRPDKYGNQEAGPPTTLVIRKQRALPALSRMLKAVGCQARIPTLLLWPSRVTRGSVMGPVRPPSGICHTWGTHSVKHPIT